MCLTGERIRLNTCTQQINNKKKTTHRGLFTNINTTRKWPGKRRNPSLDDSNERKSLTVCYTVKYVRLRQETGQLTAREIT
jgi:hypothetical protein